MRSYDIVLNDRFTPCDVFIRNLVAREWFSAENGIVINPVIISTALQCFLKVSDGVTIRVNSVGNQTQLFGSGVQSSIYVSSDASFSSHQFTSAEPNAVTLSVRSAFEMRRYRKLYEVDPLTLAEAGPLTLKDLSYIVL